MRTYVVVQELPGRDVVLATFDNARQAKSAVMQLVREQPAHAEEFSFYEVSSADYDYGYVEARPLQG